MSKPTTYTFTEDFIPYLLNNLGCMCVYTNGNNTYSCTDANVTPKKKIYQHEFSSRFIHDKGLVYLNLFELAKELVPNLTLDEYKQQMLETYSKTNSSVFIIITPSN